MEQIQFETNGLTWLAVYIRHKTSGWFHIRPSAGITTSILVYNHGPLMFGREFISLPDGSWKFHAVTPLTEEQAKLLVPKTMKGMHGMLETFPLYTEHSFMKYVYTAKESGESLLRSNGIESAEKRVILIKQD